MPKRRSVRAVSGAGRRARAPPSQWIAPQGPHQLVQVAGMGRTVFANVPVGHRNAVLTAFDP
jgi:hypothetical protein